MRFIVIKDTNFIILPTVLCSEVMGGKTNDVRFVFKLLITN